MMGRKGKEDFVDKHNMLEIVDQALAVQEIHGDTEEIPVQRLCEAQAPGLAGDVDDANHLLEGHDLYGGYDHYHVDVALEKRGNEGTDHDHAPNGSSDEGLLFLLKVRERRGGLKLTR
jgi:hypothetical protein